jgi:hypothetical protein
MVATNTISADTITPASSLRKFLIIVVFFSVLLPRRERIEICQTDPKFLFRAENSAEAAETPFDRELQQNCLSQATDEDFRELLQSTADAVTTITA